MATRPRTVDEYVRELERALRDVQTDRRNEIATEIEAHIDSQRAPRARDLADAHQ